MVKYQRKKISENPRYPRHPCSKKLLRQRTRITQMTLMNADKEKDILLKISEKKSAKIRVIRVIRVQKTIAAENADNADDTDERR